MATDNTIKSRKLKVGVMRGGPSSEYEVSLKTGGNVLSALRDRHTVRDILIDKNGVWHIDGLARNPERIFPHVDVMFNALHGQYGEDGRVQQILDSHGVAYTGSKSLPSAIGMNKILSKKFFVGAGLKTARHLEVKSRDLESKEMSKIWDELGARPMIVKPTSAGSSIGVSLVRDHQNLKEAIESALEHSTSALIEEFIEGREATCGVVQGSFGNDTYALSPVEIKNLSENKDVWDYESKYSDALHELVCPGNFTSKEEKAIQSGAMLAHKALGLRHYSRSDFIVSDDGVYILEVNTLPGMTAASLFPKALAVADCTLGDFLDHIILLAVNGK
jgi:D-alanine-D-alanine ligase